MANRPTISEVARRAGVSKSAVSYAFNGKPGVSVATRKRVLKVAAEMGWHPSTVGRALAGNNVGSIGLVLNRPATLLGLEPFYMEFISGMNMVLAPADVSLVLKVVGNTEDECDTYRKWVAAHKVDGVLLVDLIADDPRVPLVHELDLAAIAVGPKPDERTVAVWTDDDEAMRQVIRYLAALGHTRIARVTGTSAYLHTQDRDRAMRSEAAALGLEAIVVSTDFGQEEGAEATRELLARRPSPTAIIYDNDVMTAGGLATAQELGVHVPSQLSLVAWDDSIITTLTNPALTSVSSDAKTYGQEVTAALLDLLDGKQVTSKAMPPPRLIVRGSTAPLASKR